MQSHAFVRMLGILSLSLLASCPLVSAQCSSVDSDPFPLSGTSLSLVEGSDWMVSTLGRERAGVRFYSLTSLDSSLLTSPLVASKPSCMVIGGSTMYSPTFGKSLAVTGNVAAIGAPNRRQTDSPTYSSIDIVNLSAFQSSQSYSASGVVTTLFDSTVPNLGLIVALDTQQSFLASYYTASSIAVFSPITARSSNSFDSSSSSKDAMVNLPSGFRLDSFSLNKGILLVSGVTPDATSGNCVPQLYSYVFVAASRSWTQSGSQQLLRSTTSGSSADVNSIPCISNPSNAIPVKLSGDGTRAIVGIPTQNCVYAVDVTFGLLNAHTLTPHVRCADASQFGSMFGKAVSFTSAVDGASFAIASSLSVSQFAYADWINSAVDPLDPSYDGFYQFPNRFQSPPTATTTSSSSSVTKFSVTSVTRTVAALASLNRLSVIQYNPTTPNPSAADLVVLVAGNALPSSGQQWNPATNSIEACPAGRFATAANALYAPCQLCPVGTYQPSTGASSCIDCSSTAYCPAGSVSNSFLSASYDVSNSVTAFLPWFEFDGFRVSFEELLVGTIFSVNAWPVMILFFILLILTVIIYVSSYWSEPDGDDKDCCSTCGNCCLHTWRLYGRFKYFTLGRPAPFPYSPRQKEIVPDVITYSATGEPVDSSGVAPPTKPPTQLQVRNADGSITISNFDSSPLQTDLMNHSPECAGFMTLVFLLFALSAVCFTGMYVRSYDPDQMTDTRHQNVIRSRDEFSRTNGLIEQEYTQSIAGLMANPFTIKLSAVGYSGTCSAAALSSFTWSGCTYPNPIANRAPLPCNGLTASVVSTALSASNSTASLACELSVSFPKGSSFPSESSFQFVLLPTLTYQLLKLSFASNASTIPLSLPPTGTPGSSSHDVNTASIGAFTFTENLFQSLRAKDASGASIISLAPASLVTRRWLLTPVAYRNQRKSEWGAVFDSTWYASVSDNDSPLLSTQTVSSFLYADASTSTTVRVQFSVSDSITVNQTQRFLGGQAVLIIMILMVVAIYHLIALAESLFIVAYGMCGRKADNAISTVAQSHGATGVTLPSASNPAGLHSGALPPLSLPLDMPVNRYPPMGMHSMPDVVVHPPPMPVYGNPYIYEQQQHTSPFPISNPYAAAPVSEAHLRSRAVTPRHVPGAMPLTPSPQAAFSNTSTFEQDRARLQHNRRMGLTPRGAADERQRIEIEMSQGGLFEV